MARRVTVPQVVAGNMPFALCLVATFASVLAVQWLPAAVGQVVAVLRRHSAPTAAQIQNLFYPSGMAFARSPFRYGYLFAVRCLIHL